MVGIKTFRKMFSKSFVKKLKESLVPLGVPIDKKRIIDELYEEISSFVYHPSVPREYIVFNKYNCVARMVPTFIPKDYFLYYFCIKMVESDIAKNRIAGTFGGWRMGNLIKLEEDMEEDYLEYIMANSYNPFLWIKNWKAFQKKAYQYGKTGKYNYFIKFDIANFYDSINLDLLQRKVYLIVPKNKRFYVELLFHFLSNWNKKFEGYSYKLLGIPQDELTDCSRILANFYLQDFDKFMYDLCESNDSKYLRFADDPVVYSRDRLTARTILFEASKYLFRIGLNVNSSKVQEFDGVDEFNTYWAFELFDLLESNSVFKINEGVEKFLCWRDDGVGFRESSVFKKILGLDFKIIRSDLKEELQDIFLDEEIISMVGYWGMSRIYDRLSAVQKKQFLKILEKLVYEVGFNHFHYSLMKFYSKKKISFNKKLLLQRIEDLKI